jgi:hypothetical protein
MMAEPASTTAAVAAAAAAKLFQTTLLILYFTTAATTVKVDKTTKPKFEKTKIWTLQSTSQIPTENPNMCVSIGTQYIHEFDEVSTVTVRAYCMCPEAAANQDKSDACFNQGQLDQKNPKIQSIVPKNAPPATILRLGPDSTLENPSGNR